MAKPTKPGRAVLLAQGRCFRCRRRGHLAADCKRKKAPKLTLADLPIEILEMICDELAKFEKPWDAPAQSLFSLRLTCKAISHKTYDYFGRTAFRRLRVAMEHESLQWALNVSQRPALATNVEHISFLLPEQETFSYITYLKALKTSLSDDVPDATRSKARETYERYDAIESSRAFVEQSGLNSIMLNLALAGMPNIQSVELPLLEELDRLVSIRRNRTGHGESTTHVFSTVLASAAYAGIRLQKIRIGMSESCHRPYTEGVSLQSLSMPPEVMCSLNQLTELHLWLETNEPQGRFRSTYCKSYTLIMYDTKLSISERLYPRSPCNPHRRLLSLVRLLTVHVGIQHWKHHLSIFLASTPQLRRLHFGFRGEWADTEAVFRPVASLHLEHLADLSLHHMRCLGGDLQTFLKRNDGLRVLSLRNLDLVGPVGYAEVLEVLRGHHCLVDFKSDQIAQDGFRTYFES